MTAQPKITLTIRDIAVPVATSHMHAFEDWLAADLTEKIRKYNLEAGNTPTSIKTERQSERGETWNPVRPHKRRA